MSQYIEEIMTKEGAKQINYDALANKPIQRIVSENTERLGILRNMDSGVYVLSGRFRPYAGASEVAVFTDNMLVNIVRQDDKSAVQVFSPENNAVQHFVITDSDYTLNTTRMGDMDKIAMEVVKNAEAAAVGINAHPPAPGPNGTWLVWDAISQSYKESDVPLPDGNAVWFTEQTLTKEQKLQTQRNIGLGQYVTPQMFGAKGDGVTDDSAAVQAMIDATPDGGVIFFPAGVYVMNSFANIKSGALGYFGAVLCNRENMTVYFAEGAVLKSIPNSENSTTIGSSLLGVIASHNIKIIGGEFIGEYDEHTFATVPDTSYFNQSGVTVDRCSHVILDGIKAHNFIGACIYVGGNPKSDTVEIRNCLAYHSHYHAIVVEGADNVKIINTTAYDACTNRNFGCSIDVEGISSENKNQNIYIDGCDFGAAEAASLNINKCKNVKIFNSFIHDSKLCVQPSEDITIFNCSTDNAFFHILQSGSKNIVFKQNTVKNGMAQIQLYSSDSGTLDNIEISGNTIIFDDTFETYTYGYPVFSIGAQGKADVLIDGNTVMCSSGMFYLLSSDGGKGNKKTTINGNRFILGSSSNRLTKLYREQFTFAKLPVDFTNNTVDMWLDDAVTPYSSGNRTASIRLFTLSPNGEDSFVFANNRFNLIGKTNEVFTNMEFINTYNDLPEVPSTRYLDFMNNSVYSDISNVTLLQVPVGFITRVYNNISTGYSTRFINEQQGGVSAANNIIDSLT